MTKLSTLAPGDWVTAHSRRQPDHACVVTPERTFSYAEVNRRATRLAHGLRELGIAHGDRITIMSTDSADYVHLVLASMKLGSIALPMNFRLSPSELATVLASAAPALHVASPRYAGSLDAARSVSPRLKSTLMLDCDRAGADATVGEVAGSGAGEAELVSATGEEDILFLMLTSGTTGTPKMVMQSQRMVRAVAYSGVYEQRLRAGDFMYSGAPLFHVAGLGHVMYALACGGSSLILPQWEADTALHWLQYGDLNHCMLVPSMAMSLLEHPRIRDVGYPRLRSIMFGGAPMPPALMRQMYDVFGSDLYNAFGSTQVGGQTVFNADDHKRAIDGEERLLGSIGRPVMGTDIRIRDEDGNDVALGDVGEIWTRSESVFSGYLDQPELTAATVVDGWYRSGDLGHMTADGYVFLGGRSDDMIIRGGENVYPVEIESVLSEHRSVLEAAVIGMDDEYWGQIVVAAVTTREGSLLTLADMRAHCRERLASYKVPERLYLVTEMPRNSTGKIQKRLLRQMAAANTIAAAD